MVSRLESHVCEHRPQRLCLACYNIVIDKPYRSVGCGLCSSMQRLAVNKASMMHN